MDTTTHLAEVTADTQAVLEHLATGRPLDEQTYRRIRERGEQITEEIRREQGELNIAVDLVRETRDEL